MVSLLTLLGFALGWAAPAAALCLLLALVSVTSSLAWQLGFANEATALGYAVGLVAGYAGGRTADWMRARGGDAGLVGAAEADASAGGSGRRGAAGPDVDPTMRLSAIAAMALLGCATSVSLARNYIVPADAAIPLLRATANDLGTFNPPALAGVLQAALVAALGYAVFLVAASALREARHAARALRAFHIGVGIAVGAPLAQALFLDPTVRADRARDSSLGLVAFFQDPHGYAAFLALAVNVTAATSILNWRLERRRRALAGAALTMGAVVALLLTGSRSGTAIGLVTLAATSVTAVVFGARERRTAAIAVGAAAVAVTLIAVMVVAVSAGSGFTGSSRLLEPLDADSGLGDLVEGRVYRAQVAAGLIRARPLWGLGPGGYFDAQVARWVGGAPRPTFGPVAENVHNYYLQLATDYGLPVLVAFCVFWGLLGSRMIRALRWEVAGPRRPLLLGIGGGVVALLLFSLVSHPFLVAELHTLVGAVAGLGYALSRASMETPL